MTISILTLFPEVFREFFSSSIIGRAVKKKLVKINLVNIRDFAKDKHKTVDDKPYGGGVGMLLRVDIVERAIANSKLKIKNSKLKERVILLDPAGKLYNQSIARKYSKLDHLALVCGHYEGVDARIKYFVDEAISIGEYVLTGGEVAALVIADSVTRLLPNVLSKKQATVEESFSKGRIIEAPAYTRPKIFKSHKVPEILLSGNHKAIEKWRKKQSQKRTKEREKNI